MTQTLETETTVDRIKIHKTSPELYDAMMALTINAWNRIGVTTRLPLPKR